MPVAPPPAPQPQQRVPRHPLIPRLEHGACQVWWSDPRAWHPRLAELLDDDERRRHASYLREADRARFLVAHALARILAAAHLRPADVHPRTIAYAAPTASPGAARVKPRFAGAAADLELSIAHSGRRVVVALSRAVPVGVDVECCDRHTVARSLVESVLAPAEQGALDALPAAARTAGFYRYWTRKEAVLKATGDGLSVSPTRVAVSAPSSPPALIRWAGPGRPAPAVHLHDLDAGLGYAAALASVGARLERSEHDATAVLKAWS